MHLPLFDSYHVRIPIPGPASAASAELSRARKKASSQDAQVLQFFRSNPGPWAPSEVHAAFLRSGQLIDLNSVRRAITNNTNRGDLRRTSIRVPSPRGGREWKWEAR